LPTPVPEKNPPQKTLFVVEDDPALREFLRLAFREEVDEVVASSDCRTALTLMDRGISPDVILLDLMLPGMSGLEFLETTLSRKTRPKIIVISALSDVNTVVKAMQLGAMDYVQKPFELAQVHALVGKAIAEGGRPSPSSQASKAVISSPTGGDNTFHPGPLLFESPQMSAVRETAAKVATTDIPVLITGESGVGKEVVAREVHRLSAFSGGPFVKVNCAALPASLLESELFGYEKGAFTGAVRSKPSKFENASNGTLLLDEIGELELSLQAKLLHVLQDGSFTRLGSNRAVQSRARVIVSTNRELEREMAHGAFRSDLFYRLNVVRIHVPPLRDRVEDVILLANHFLETYNRAYGRSLRFGPREMDLIKGYHWPGNVRELQNTVRRYVVLEHFGREDLGLPGTEEGFQGASVPPGPGPEPIAPPPEAGTVNLKEISRAAAAEAEKKAILDALTSHNWNRTKAARALRISYKALLYKIKDHQLDEEGKQ